MTANKKGKKIRNSSIVCITEVLGLTAAAVSLSVISSMLPLNLLGFLCVAMASALFACVLFLVNPGAIIIAGMASFAVSFALSGDITCACASLIYIVIGALIYFGVRKKKNRTQITVRIACALAVVYAAYFAFSFMSSTGRFSITGITSVIDSELTNGVETLVGQYNTTLSQYAGEIEAAQSAYIGEDAVKELVTSLKALIPAFFVLYNLLIAYLATALFKPAYNIFIPMANPNRKRIKNKYWRVNISSVSAIIMITAIIFAFVLSKEPLPSAVVMNLIYILAPGFCIMGIYVLYDKIFKPGAGLLPVMMIVSAVMLIMLFPLAAVIALYTAIAVLMAAGLYSALIGDIKKFIDKAKKVMLGDDDDNNDDNDDDYID